MITTTFYNIEEKVFNSPEGMGVWGWTNITRNKKITDLVEAEAIMVSKKARWDSYLAAEMTKPLDQVALDHIANLQANSEFRIVEDVKTFTHVSEYCYSDVRAYEIIKVISDKTIEIRAMVAKHDIGHLDQFVGGFGGHVENQHHQKVDYSSDPTGQVIRIRRKRNDPNAWTSNGSRFGLTEQPYAFYDFNF